MRDPNRDRLHLCLVGGRHPSFAGPSPDFVRKAVHLLFQLGGCWFLERGEHFPALEAECSPFARSLLQGGVKYEGAIQGANPGPQVRLGVLHTAVHRGPSPVVVVDTPDGPSSAVALALEQPDERSLELLAGAGVDDGIHAAVEVSQPEDDLEDHFWRLQRWEERTLEEMERNKVRKSERTWQHSVARLMDSHFLEGEPRKKAEVVFLTLGPWLAILLISKENLSTLVLKGIEHKDG